MKPMHRCIILCLLLSCIPIRAAETTLKDNEGLIAWLYTPTAQPDPARTCWLVVGVHGGGGNGKGACGISSFAKEDVIVLGPTFSNSSSDPAAASPDSFQRAGQAHEAKLKSLVAEVGRTWKLHPKILLHGFSAGAQFVHRFAFKNPELVAGVCAHSSGTWAGTNGDDRINPAAKGIPFAVSCGEADRTRVEGCRVFADTLKSLGFNVEIKTWPGVGHKLTNDTLVMTGSFFQRVRSGNAPGRR